VLAIQLAGALDQRLQGLVAVGAALRQHLLPGTVGGQQHAAARFGEHEQEVALLQLVPSNGCRQPSGTAAPSAGSGGVPAQRPAGLAAGFGSAVAMRAAPAGSGDSTMRQSSSTCP
jgi:hypothetical protein